MSDPDQPPREAVEAVTGLWAKHQGCPNICAPNSEACDCACEAEARLMLTLPAAARIDLLAWLAETLPDAQKWRAAARLARGLEPTDAMGKASRITVNHPGGGRTHVWAVNRLAAMLAAAEAGDGECPKP